ncbi:MAG: Ig-like domain-containing protein [Beduini sp.]|uniref:Ig-like domain-containing protein n=1 Tax=Beduini sp. TaxID=1922300 RepID=UPI00399F4357
MKHKYNIKKIFRICWVILLTGTMFASLLTTNFVHAAGGIILNKGTIPIEYATIQEAIDAIGDGEVGTIDIPAGTYNESIKIENLNNSQKQLSRTVILRGAQADVSAVADQNQRTGNETILTGGIEVNGLLNADSLEINGFTFKQKGINMIGWGAPINTTGSMTILNNVITDIADNQNSAIHINAASNETIDSIKIKNNYIRNIGEGNNSANGIYISLTANKVDINDNYIGYINHSSIQISNLIVKSELNILGNSIIDWNQDGADGAGSLTSQGDGIYLPKGSVSPAVPMRVNYNYIVRNNALPGNSGWAVRCGYNKGSVDLSKNYWAADFPLSKISGGTYPNVIITSVCDENMNETQQSIGDFKCSFSSLYLSGSTKEKALNPTITLLNGENKPKVEWTSDHNEIVAIEEREDQVYYVAKGTGTARLTGKIIDSKTNKAFIVTGDVKVIDIDMQNITMPTLSQCQLQIAVLPQDESLGSSRKIEYTSSDESIAAVDSTGLVSSKDKKGQTEITTTVYMYSFGTTIYAQKTITLTVDKEIPITEITMKKTLLLEKGDSQQLQVEILPMDTTADKTITWGSSDESIATVDNSGTLITHTNGKATVTATIGNLSTSCEVSVYEIKEPNIQPIDPTRPTEVIQTGIYDTLSQTVITNDVNTILTDLSNDKEISADIIDNTTLTAIKTAMNAGKSITTEVVMKHLSNDSVSPDIRNQIDASLSNQSGKTDILQYFDFSILLITNEGEILGEIKQFSKPLTYRVKLAEGTETWNKQFHMIRSHKNEITKIPLILQDDNTLLFSTDQFSLYALVAETKDIDISQPEIKPTQPVNPKNDIEIIPTKELGPVKTADESPVNVWLHTITVSGIAFVILWLNKKRKQINK